MDEKNRKIFLAILAATLCVVALVWIATAPNTPTSPHATSTSTNLATGTPAKKEPRSVPKPLKVLPPINDTSLGLPTSGTEKPVSTLVMPDIVPPMASGTKHVDPRIAATIITSGESFDRLVDGIKSLFVYVLTH